MADCSEFPIQLANTGIAAEIHDETLGFDFDDFESAWEVLAGVTTANLGNEASTQAHKFNSKNNVGRPDAPRYFRNTTQTIVGRRSQKFANRVIALCASEWLVRAGSARQLLGPPLNPTARQFQTRKPPISAS